MFEIILENMKLIGLLFGLYGLFFFSNTMFGLYLNIDVFHEKFEWSKLFHGLRRGIVLLLGVASLVIGISTTSTIINLANIVDIPTELIDGVSMVVISSVMIYGGFDYAKQSIEKFKIIMKNKEIGESNEK